MSDWGRFNDQFRETVWETRQRQAETRRKRTAEGKCWQCAKLIEVCDCSNLNHSSAHPKPSKKSVTEETE